MQPEQVAEFYRFMKAREQIRLNREAGLPWPWTEDEILQTYKFTNVKRAHDRVTRELVERMYAPHRGDSIEVKLLNCAIFRYFGTTEFAEAVGWSLVFDPERLKDIAADRLARRERVFTGAYVITNQGIKAPKQEVVVDIFLAGLWNRAEELADVVCTTSSWRRLIERMATIKGYGGTGFMAKEIVLDSILAGCWPHGDPVDFNAWCPAGPGARRGINRLLGRDLNVSMTTKGAQSYLLELFAARDELWPAGFVELCLHDIQFQLCEFDKYERVRLGQGRPRSRYRQGAKDG